MKTQGFTDPFSVYTKGSFFMAEVQKKINVDQVISYLNHAFAKVTQKYYSSTKNSKGTELYQFQVDFCYLIDGIQRGPSYTAPKLITNANNLISDMEKKSALLERGF